MTPEEFLLVFDSCLESVLEKPISVTAMAKKLSLSRSHFWVLTTKKQVFPRPAIVNGRPMYTPDLQRVCLQVKRTGVTVNGDFTYFNEKSSKGTNKKPTKKFGTLIESLQGLGLQVNASQIEIATKEVYPSEKPDLDSPEVIKALFLHLKS
jgi:hypothetical protein